MKTIPPETLNKLDKEVQATFPPLKHGDAFTVVLSSDGPEEFDISQVQAAFSAPKK